MVVKRAYTKDGTTTACVGSNADAVAFDVKWFRQCFNHFARHGVRIVAPANVPQHQDKFVAACARDRILFAHGIHQALRNHF